MTNWEYETYIVAVTQSGPGIDLAKMGTDGWELVSVVPKKYTLFIPEMEIKPAFARQDVTARQAATGQVSEMLYYFKRPARQ